MRLWERVCTCGGYTCTRALWALPAHPAASTLQAAVGVPAVGTETWHLHASVGMAMAAPEARGLVESAGGKAGRWPR